MSDATINDDSQPSVVLRGKAKDGNKEENALGTVDPIFSNSDDAQSSGNGLFTRGFHVSTAKEKSAERTCNKCGLQGVGLQRCARCKKVWYCGRECQREDWKTHKGKCVNIGGNKKKKKNAKKRKKDNKGN